MLRCRKKVNQGYKVLGLWLGSVPLMVHIIGVAGKLVLKMDQTLRINPSNKPFCECENISSMKFYPQQWEQRPSMATHRISPGNEQSGFRVTPLHSLGPEARSPETTLKLELQG